MIDSLGSSSLFSTVRASREPAVLRPQSANQQTTVTGSTRGGRVMSFGTVVDAINPLQQAPVVSSIYRARTGDEANDVAKLAGHVGYGALLGGPIGAAIGAGIFGLEKLFSLFSSGKSADEEVALSVRDEASPENMVSVRADGGWPGAQVLAPSAAAAMARPQLTPGQFGALLQSIGQEAKADQMASAATLGAKSEPGGDAEVAQRMRDNLAKYEKMQALAQAK